MSRHSLLFVDDEANILESLQRVFRRQEYDIRMAVGGEQAWALVQQRPADLIISDQRMPGVTGVEFLTRVKSRYPDTVRMILTGNADLQTAVAAINDGQVHRFLTKPWNNEELKLTVRQALEQQDLVLENRRLNELVVAQNEELKQLNAGLERKVDERTVEIRSKNDELSQLYAELDQSFDDSIRVFAALAELRDKYVGSHSKRVADASKALAKVIGLPPQAIRDVERSALLHDIGKIGLPGHLLYGTGIMNTDADRAILQRHPVLGQAALQIVPQLQGVGVIIRHHHERFDGKGYPDGLGGRDIPLAARIIAVADRYDYLIYRRDRNAPASEDQALSTIHQGASTAFDPAIVKIFVSLPGPWRFQPPEAATDDGQISIEELREGMVLAKDLYTAGGLLLAPKDTVIKQAYIDRIANYHRVDPIKGGIHVRRSGTSST